MKRDTINQKQTVMLAAVFVISSQLVSDADRRTAQDTWIVILISLAVILPFVIMFARLSCLCGQRDIFEMMDALFGRRAGAVLSLVLTVYALMLAGITAVDFSLFTRYVSLRNTPIVFIVIPFILLCGWLALSGVQVIGRMGVLAFAFIAAMLTIVLCFSVTRFELNRLLPVLDRPAQEVARSGVMTVAHPYGELVLFLAVIGRLKRGQSRYRPLFLGAVTGGLMFAAVSLQNLLMLGADAFYAIYYPYAAAVNTIEIGDSVSRLQSIVASGMLIGVFIKTAVCLYCATRGLRHLFNRERPRWMLLLLACLAAVGFSCAYPTTGALLQFNTDSYWLIALPVQLGLPFVCWMVAELKHRRKKTAPQ